jgi:hypothetical protein
VGGRRPSRRDARHGPIAATAGISQEEIMQPVHRSICFATVTLAIAATSPGLAEGNVTISGATLFEPFFQTQASGNDFLDVDNDGVITNFDAFTVDTIWNAGATGGSPTHTNPFANLQYRAIGSGNGLQELIDYGSVNGPVGGGTTFPAMNAINGGAPNVRNGGDALIGTFTGPAIVDMSTTDVPTTWFVTDTNPGAYWGNAPVTAAAPTAGYGNNPGLSNAVEADLTPSPFQAGGQSNKLKSLTPTGNSPGSTTLNLNTGSPDANTVYATQIAAAPIGYIANAGAAIDSDSSDSVIDGNIKKSELQQIFTTGRTVKGENLVAITRDSGSGTRNGAMNSIGVDPSWGLGDNVGLKNRGSSSETSTGSLDTPGPDYIPTNKNSSSRLEKTVKNTRLGVSYNGIVGNASEDSVANNYELLNVMNDTAGGTQYVRPIMTRSGTTAANNNVVFNADPNTGWQAGAIQTLSTIGNPFSGQIIVDANGVPRFDNGPAGPGEKVFDPAVNFPNEDTTGPTMADPYAAMYIRNVVGSINAVTDTPGDIDLLGTPGERLASSFALVNALDALPGADNPGGLWDNNPSTNTGLQAASVLPKEDIEASYGGDYGFTPIRDTSGSDGAGAVYTDGQTGQYLANDGTAIAYGVRLEAGTALGDANAIAGDFDGDLDRDVDDLDDMVAAYEAAAGIQGSRAGLAVAKQSLEIVGDFNADGNFDLDDVRYGADGLFNVGRTDDILDRRANFTAVDHASTSGNLFGTTLATEVNAAIGYAAGDSAGDIAGSGQDAAGWAPLGADGTVDAQDIDYLNAQFNYDPANAAGAINLADGVQWTNVDEVMGKVMADGQRVDLSADMNGDLTIDQEDTRVLVEDILKTAFGDFNLDGLVSNADVAILRTNLGGTANGWATGDANGDSLVSNADVTRVRNNLGFSSAPAPAVTANTFATQQSGLTPAVSVGLIEASDDLLGNGVPNFVYDPDTGELILTADGSALTAITVNTADALLKPTDAFPQGLGDVIPNTWVYNVFAGNPLFEFTDTTFGFNPESDAVDFLLALLPTGLTAADFGLIQYQTVANANFQTADFIVIPEPASLALLAAGVGVLGLRRRSA